MTPNEPREGASVPAGDAAQAASPAAAALPCLNSHNCNEPREEKPRVVLTTNARKTAYALVENVAYLIGKYGLNKVLFNTLTFRDHVLDGKEAQRRLHSLSTGVLANRYLEWIVVMERQKSGRIHYHLLCATASDVRTGFSFEEAANGVYRSASVALRAEWAFWRRTAPAYGFGRTEQLPIKSSAEGISKYVGKYIAKHMDSRRREDKRLRLVRYSSGAKSCGNHFAWTSPGARLYRAKLRTWARLNGVSEYEQLKEVFGPRWAWKYRDSIAATVVRDDELPSDLVLKQAEELVGTSRLVAESLGLEWTEIFRILHDRAA